MEIINNADIFFDFNDPVRTNDAVLTTDLIEGMAQYVTEGLGVTPNPINDVVNISSSAWIDRVVILAADGREVMRASLQASAASFDVSHLKPGPYVLAAIMNGGSLLQRRFIKY